MSAWKNKIAFVNRFKCCFYQNDLEAFAFHYPKLPVVLEPFLVCVKGLKLANERRIG